MKRILDCRASDFRQMDREALKGAILAAEGRTVMAETVVTSQPLLPEITNAEFAKAFGADMILLNVFDVFHPQIRGIESRDLFPPDRGSEESELSERNPIAELQRLMGLPVTRAWPFQKISKRHPSPSAGGGTPMCAWPLRR